MVADVPADATARDAVSARDAARVQGEQAAFQQLLQRLTAPADWPRLPQPDADSITGMLVDFQVANEHSSAVRYLANFTFRFNPKAVRELLRDAGIAFSEMASKPVVIVPVLVEPGGSHLWDDPNPWRKAWDSVPGGAGLVPFVVPVGDLADVSALDLPDATQPKPEQLQALAQHYDDGNVVVAAATLSGGPGGAHLEIAVTRYGDDGVGTPLTTAVDGPQADASLYLAGVQAAAKLLEGAWKQQTFAPPATPGDERTVEAAVTVAGPGDWAQIRQRLLAASVVRGVEVELMTRSQIRVKFATAADPATLKIGLAQQDLVLAEGVPYATLGMRPRVEPAPPAQQ